MNMPNVPSDYLVADEEGTHWTCRRCGVTRHMLTVHTTEECRNVRDAKKAARESGDRAWPPRDLESKDGGS